MIARHEGQILLVSGAIPGERVRVRIERAEKRLAFAATIEVIDRSADRRPASDPLCGGCLYSHIAYPRQVDLKAAIIADTFTRIGRIPVDGPVPVTPSPATGYRLRSRLHVRAGAAGFFRVGTHELCDPRTTNQLSTGAVDSIDRALAALGDARDGVASLELSENIGADERALHFDVVPDARTMETALGRAVEAAQLTGCTARGHLGPFVRVGNPSVSDPLATLTRGESRPAIFDDSRRRSFRGTGSCCQTSSFAFSTQSPQLEACSISTPVWACSQSRWRRPAMSGSRQSRAIDTAGGTSARMPPRTLAWSEPS